MAQITVNEMATNLETTPRELRKFLRSVTPKDEQPGKGSRWSLDGSKRSVTKLQKQFAEWTEAKAKPVEDSVEEIEVDDSELDD